jgi:hypothetical protein
MDAVHALTAIFIHCDQIRHGPIASPLPAEVPTLDQACDSLGAQLSEQIPNILRHFAIFELRQLPPGPEVTSALDRLRPEVPGSSTCQWECLESSNEPEPKSPGVRRVTTKVTVKRPLDDELRAILDPQAWDKMSSSFLKAHVVHPKDIKTTPPQDDIPRTGKPPKLGSIWSELFFEHVGYPAAAPYWRYLNLFKITTKGPAPYSYKYDLVESRWSEVFKDAGCGGLKADDGELDARQSGSSTTIGVFKLIKAEARSIYTGEAATQLIAASLRAVGCRVLGEAVSNCP